MKVYLALGTNLGDRMDNLQNALTLIEQRVGKVVDKAMPIQTQPVGFESENLFLNTAISVETDMELHTLFYELQAIEKEMGRTVHTTNGLYADRIIDLDILFYGDMVVNEEALQIPHAKMLERAFVLDPLFEIAPDFVHPVLHKTIGQLWQECHGITIERVLPDSYSPNFYEEVNELMEQLTHNATPLTTESFDKMIANPDTALYILREIGNPKLLGMSTLCYCTSPTGTKAWVEDVVVHEKTRGKGYGKALLNCLKVEARKAGAKSANLTSRPKRVAANRLYQSLGFEKRETNVYKYALI